MDHTLEALERVEARAWRQLLEAVPDRAARALGLEVHHVAGTTALVAEHVDHPMLNRTIGLGTLGAADAATIREVARLYADRGVRRCFVHVPATRVHELGASLRAEGLARYRRAWVKLARARGAPLPPAGDTTLTARPARADDAGTVGHILSAAFDLPAGAAPLFAAALGLPDWQVFVATDGDVVVGAGLSFVEAELAYFAAAATAPSHRRRGAQSLLLRARVQDADARGCALAASETGEAVPGDPQHSFRNLVRHGFHPVGTRPNFAPIGTVWRHGVRSSEPSTP